MFRNKSVDASHFAMVPRADVPRSAFNMQQGYKTTFDAGYLIPVFCDEMLPGDQWSLSMTAFTRLSTLLFPVMDNLHMDSHFFFIPYRLIWDHWPNFMGERRNPSDSIDYVVPQMVSPNNGYAIGSLQDYFALPTVGQITTGQSVTHSSLPLRAYNLVWNEWFRDENLQNSVVVDVDDGPDSPSDYVLLKRGKRKDYFTSALPWPQKGTAVALPLGTSAPVYGTGKALGLQTNTTSYGLGTSSGTTQHFSGWTGNLNASLGVANSGSEISGDVAVGVVTSGASGLFADLSQATASTVNALRTSFQVQKLLERDARGGTRYTEILLSHFGVRSPDARLQRPEYLGGGSTVINVNPIAQTSGTSASGTTTPLGTLAAMGTGLAGRHGFKYSCVEHGVVIGLVSVRADLTYQQGMRKFWRRRTRYDFYFPSFSHLGEQAIYNWEIYTKGDATPADALVFGYQERWAEYRYTPSLITGLFRSTSSGTIDPWHLAQNFASLPSLDTTFIQEDPPVSRVVAAGSGANGKQFIFDSVFSIRAVRPMPLYSVPGLIDHF